MELARKPKEAAEIPRSLSSYEYTVTVGQPPLARKAIYFSPRELRHLFVAALLVMGVGLSSILFSTVEWLAVVVFGIVLTASFLAHEFAHKFSAQRMSLWAEFRLTLWGALLTLFSVISPMFKIIAPGAVMISGSKGPREMGKISLAGPLTNIFLSAILMGPALIPSIFSRILLQAAFINGFMAVFNLVPFGILDGYKIFQWDKKIWGMVFATSLVLMITSYYLY